MKPGKNKNLRFLLIFGLIGAITFVTTFLLEGAFRNDYNPWKYPVSSLSIGKSGWIQKINFIISGSLIIVFSAGLRKILLLASEKTTGALNITLVGIGLICAGIFTTDPVYGYPEDHTLILSQFTVHGHLHDIFSLLVFVCLPTACIIFRKHFLKYNKRSLAVYSTATIVIVIIAFVSAALGFKQHPMLVNAAGAFQRISIITGCFWLSVISLHFSKNSRLI